GLGQRNPCVDIIFGRVVMSVPLRRYVTGPHVRDYLEHGHDRNPAETRGNSGTAWRRQPFRRPVQHLRLEEHDGVARVLQEGDAQGAPGQSGHLQPAFLIGEANNRAVAEPWQPGWRTGHTTVRRRAPGLAPERRPAPQGAIEDVANDVVNIEG